MTKSKRLLSSMLILILILSFSGFLLLSGFSGRAAEPIFSQSFADIKEGNSLPDGFSPSGNVLVKDGYIELQQGSVLLLPSSVSEKNFTYKVQFTIANANEASRWAGFLYRFQSSSNYMQMCVRQNAAGEGGVDTAQFNGNWQYPTNAKGSFYEPINKDKIYEAKIAVKDNKLALYINDTLCVLSNPLIDAAGRFGIQANGSTVRVYGVSVEAPEEIPLGFPKADGKIKDIYESETGIIGAPSVIQKIETNAQIEALQNDVRTQIARFPALSNDLKITVEDKAYGLKEILTACGTSVIPMFEAPTTAIAEDFAAYALNNAETDIVLASDKHEALAAAWAKIPTLRYAYIAGEISNTNTLSDISGNTNRGNATIAVIDSGSELTREALEYLQLRAVTVWLNGKGNDSENVHEAVDTGANGVTVDNFNVAYDLYEKVTSPVNIRKVFFVGHRGMPSAAPENSKEGYIAAIEAGADAIECDVNITNDKVLISNHNGEVDGYTTTSSATGKISSLTWDYISSLKLIPKGGYSDSQFCKIEWYFQILKDNPSVVGYVEFKDSSDEVVKLTIELAEEMGVQEQVVYITFIDHALRSVKKYAPYAPVSFLASNFHNNNKDLSGNLLAFVNRIGPLAAAADFHFSDLPAEILDAGRHRGISFQTWTINELSALINFSKRNITVMTTDYANYSNYSAFHRYKNITAEALFVGEFNVDPDPTDPTETTKPQTSDTTATDNGTTKDKSPATGESSDRLTAAFATTLTAFAILLLARVLLNKKQIS